MCAKVCLILHVEVNAKWQTSVDFKMSVHLLLVHVLCMAQIQTRLGFQKYKCNYLEAQHHFIDTIELEKERHYSYLIKEWVTYHYNFII